MLWVIHGQDIIQIYFNMKTLHCQKNSMGKVSKMKPSTEKVCVAMSTIEKGGDA